MTAPLGMYLPAIGESRQDGAVVTVALSGESVALVLLALGKLRGKVAPIRRLAIDELVLMLEGCKP